MTEVGTNNSLTSAISLKDVGFVFVLELNVARLLFYFS